MIENENTILNKRENSLHLHTVGLTAAVCVQPWVTPQCGLTRRCSTETGCRDTPTGRAPGSRWSQTTRRRRWPTWTGHLRAHSIWQGIWVKRTRRAEDTFDLKFRPSEKQHLPILHCLFLAFSNCCRRTRKSMTSGMSWYLKLHPTFSNQGEKKTNRLKLLQSRYKEPSVEPFLGQSVNWI